MDGSNLFESLANFPYIFKLKKIFRSNTDTTLQALIIDDILL
jgi:hypothetical protein